MPVQDLVAFVNGQCGSGIVYAHQRKTCDWLVSGLCDADVDAAAYHAGKDPDQRARTQADWTAGNLQVVVATIAFGMGVDKPDVRWWVAACRILHISTIKLPTMHRLP